MKRITIIENILGLILAIFIVFKILPNKQTCRELNQPVYIILFLVFLVILFGSLNPIVGILMLFYGYIVLVHGKKEDDKRNQTLQEMNQAPDTELEESVIQSSEFSRIKNHFEDQMTRVQPVLEKLIV